MSKEIHLKVTHGNVDPLTAPNRGTFEFATGKSASDKLTAELNGKFGESFEDRPLIVIPFESEDSAENFKTFV